MKTSRFLRRVGGRTGILGGLVAALAAPGAAQEFVPHRLYVSSPVFANNILEFELDGTPIGLLIPAPGIPQPSGVAFGPGGELFIKTAGLSSAVVSVDATGMPAGAPIPSGGMPSGAGGLAFGPNGRLYATDVAAGTIQIFSPAGLLEDVVTAPGLDSPFGIAFGPTGDFFVTNGGTQAVFQFDPSGAVLRELSTAGLQSAVGVAVGPDEKLYVSEFGIHFVYVFHPDGTFAGAFSAPGMEGPSGLAFGPNGLLYVAAFPVNRIFVFRTDGAAQFDFDSVAPPQMLAFSPVRFGAKIKGTIASASQDPEKRSESYKGDSGPVLSFFHGMGLAMLLLEDDPGDASDLASRLGTDRLVFPGRLTPAGDKAALLSGDQIPILGEPGGHLDLDVRGSIDGSTGAFVPKKAKGAWSARAGDDHFQGRIQTGKPLE